MTIYPNGIDSILQLPTVAGITDEAIAINALRESVIAVETELGLTPHGIYSDVATRLSVLESRVGPGPGITGGSIDINDANLTGVLNIARGGTALNAVGSLHTVLTSTGTTLFYKLLDDNNIDAAAAILGTKLFPDFGSQDVYTDGYIRGASLVIGSGGPSITVGTGVPISSEPDGSVFLRTDGSVSAGVYTRQSSVWSALGGAPGGSDGYIQFNDAGSFNGDPGLTYDKNTNVLSISDALEIGLTTATTGAIRLANTASIQARDTGDINDYNLINLDNSDYVTIGNISQSFIQLGAATADWLVSVDGYQVMRAVSGILNVSIDTTNDSNSKTTVNDVVRNVQTTDATPTTIYSYTATDEAVTMVDAAITGITSDGSVVAGYKRGALFKRDGGVLSQIGSTVSNYTEEESAAWDVGLSASGTSILVTVTGENATTIQWQAVIRSQIGIP